MLRVTPCWLQVKLERLYTEIILKAGLYPEESAKSRGLRGNVGYVSAWVEWVRGCMGCVVHIFTWVTWVKIFFVG